MIPICIESGLEMVFIEERQLKDYEQNGFLQNAKIVEEQGLFSLAVTLMGSPNNELVICTQRKTRRNWQSLDRMLAHYRKIAPSVKQYQLVFTSDPPAPDPEQSPEPIP